MKRIAAASCAFILIATQAFAASGKQPAPAGSYSGAPAEFTKFSAAEIERGFLALAFGTAHAQTCLVNMMGVAIVEAAAESEG